MVTKKLLGRGIVGQPAGQVPYLVLAAAAAAAADPPEAALCC